MVMKLLLNCVATLVKLSKPDVWCAWLIFICCGILLLTWKENEKFGIGYVDSKKA
jgi:hypothetical protein